MDVKQRTPRIKIAFGAGVSLHSSRGKIPAPIRAQDYLRQLRKTQKGKRPSITANVPKA